MCRHNTDQDQEKPEDGDKEWELPGLAGIAVDDISIVLV